MENAPAKVLIFDTAWLGDVIFTTSLIGAAHDAWPHAKLHVLVAKRGEELVKHHPNVEKLWVYDKNGGDRSAISLLKLASALRRERYDVLLNAHPSFRSRLLSFLSRSKTRVGYCGFGAGIAFGHRVSNSLHTHPDHAERRVDLLRKIVPSAKSAPLLVGTSPDARRAAMAKLFVLNPTGLPVLGLIPGSARRTKRWSTEGFAEVGRRWVDKRKGIVLVFGAESERAAADSICASVGSRCHAVIQVPLISVAGLLAECGAAVGNDTGVSFLAIAAGCPRVLVLYGCTQVNFTFPWPHQAIAAGVPCCLPKTGHGRERCKWTDTPWCMQQIHPDRVWRALVSE